MTGSLELKFLGPPEVFYGGRPVRFATRKALALLAYLVVEAGPHPREKLQAIFWPESETRLAQSALRNTLARIKRGLREMDEALRVDADTVAFDFSSAYALDLDLVTRAAAELGATKIEPPVISMLQKGVEAVRGPFLDAFSLPDTPAFEDWITLQRSAWEQRLNLIFDRLSIHQLETHLVQPAIATVDRWLVLDRLNESAYRRLMRLHFLNGDRSAALQTYETCRSLLAQEWGVAPAPDTEELLAHIRSTPAPLPASVSAAKAGAPLPIPFVGRADEYQTLVGAFHRAKDGDPQIIVVAGESGIGKTRLANEFLTWAGTERADVLRGRAYETGGRLPYQPIIDALRVRLERENAPEDLLDDAWLVELTLILPELRARYPDLSLASVDESTARARLFEALARLSVSLSARRPLVWLVDDLQWADRGTLELLHYLKRSWRTSRSPILLLILIREEAFTHGSALRDWMSGLTRDIAVTRLTLAPMQASDVQQLLQSLAGENTAGCADLSAWLTAETAGRPFFVVETLAALEDYGALVWVDGEPPVLDPLATLANLKSMGSPSLAPAIHDVILSRLEWLSQPAAVLLAAAAVLGRDCSFGCLCQVSGLDEQHSLNALDELLSARLILEARDQAGPYAISHDRIREVAYAQVSQARQVVFHRRALTALAGVKAASAELAHHALAAREWQLAFQHNLLAGDEALRLYEVTTAAQHYETARSLLYQSKVDVDTGTCQQLYTRLGQAYELLFQHRDALAVYEELQAQARARDSQELELAALVACCGVLSRPFDAHDVDRARVLAQEALPLARALGNQMAEAQIERALALTFTHGDGQIEPALAHIVASATLAREAGLREQLGLALMDLGGLCLSLGQVERAESVWGEAVELFRELDNRPRLQDVLHALGMIQMGMGKFEPALAYLEQAYRANEALGSCNETYALATTRNVIHILRGAYDRVVEELRPALDMDETLIVPRLQIEIHQQLAWCYYDLGAYDEGLFHCRKAINTHDHIDPSGRFPAFSVLALLHITQGDLWEASLALERGLENFDLQHLAFPRWWEALPISLAEAELALAQDDLSRGARCVKQLLERVETLHIRHLKPGVLFLQARLALATGDRERAHQGLSDALALSAEMGAHRQVWALCWALSQLESERGNESVAVQLKEQAKAEVKFIAAHAGTPELRRIFLARPDVQRITGAA